MKKKGWLLVAALLVLNHANFALARASKRGGQPVIKVPPAARSVDGIVVTLSELQSLDYLLAISQEPASPRPNMPGVQAASADLIPGRIQKPVTRGQGLGADDSCAAPDPTGISSLAFGYPIDELSGGPAAQLFTFPFRTFTLIRQEFGLRDNGAAIPPDTQGAAGPASLVTILNSEFAVLAKDGDPVFGPISLQAFWAGLGPLPGQPAHKPFDPQLIYDKDVARFILSSVSNARGNSHLLITVSDSDEPTTKSSFVQFAIDVDPDDLLWAQFPQVGVDPTFVYVAANLMDANNQFVKARLWLFNKASLLAGSSMRFDVDLIDEFGNSLRANWSPAHSFDDTGENYLVNEGWTVAGEPHLGVLRVAAGNPPSFEPSFELNLLAVDDYGIDPLDDAPQDGCAARIETNDTRILDAVLRDGRLWVVHHVDDPVSDGVGKTEVAWYEIDPTGSPTVVQQGRVRDDDLWFYYPSISVNSNGCMALGFSGSSYRENPGAFVTIRSPFDPDGTTDRVFNYQRSFIPYLKTDSDGRNRWGDYSATGIDPTDDTSFWTLQEYSGFQIEQGCPVDQTGFWATKWLKFTCYFLETPVPGEVETKNTLTVTGASPFQSIVFVEGTTPGQREVPVQRCRPAFMDMADPRVLIELTADENGTATVKNLEPPAERRGQTVLFQTFDSHKCRKSNLVTHTWQ